MFDLRAVITTTRAYDIRRTGFASRAHSRGGIMDITRIAFLSAALTLLAGGGIFSRKAGT